MATAVRSDDRGQVTRPPVRLLARQLAAQTLRQAWHHRILGMGAEAGFWQLVSLPSLVLGALGLIGFFGDVIGQHLLTEVQHSVLHTADRLIVPSAVRSTIKPALRNILAHGRPDIVSFSFLLSMWTGSSAMACYVNTITIAYGMRHLRGALRSRALALLLYFGFLLATVVLLPLVVIGPSHLVELLPGQLKGDGRTAVHIAFWPVLIVIGIALLMTLYHLALPVRIPWRRALPGAALALTLWVSSSLLLRLYLSWAFQHESTYGALGAPVAVLLFLYLLALAVLLGAELNAEVDRMWPLPATEQARRAEAGTVVG